MTTARKLRKVRVELEYEGENGEVIPFVPIDWVGTELHPITHDFSLSRPANGWVAASGKLEGSEPAKVTFTLQLSRLLEQPSQEPLHVGGVIGSSQKVKKPKSHGQMCKDT